MRARTSLGVRSEVSASFQASAVSTVSGRRGAYVLGGQARSAARGARWAGVSRRRRRKYELYVFTGSMPEGRKGLSRPGPTDVDDEKGGRDTGEGAGAWESRGRPRAGAGVRGCGNGDVWGPSGRRGANIPRSGVSVLFGPVRSAEPPRVSGITGLIRGQHVFSRPCGSRPLACFRTLPS